MAKKEPQLGLSTNVFDHKLQVDGVFMGLDLSLTGTGVGIITPTQAISFLLDGKDIRGQHRIVSILTVIQDKVRQFRPGSALVEGYSFGSMKSHAHSLGELGGVVKLGLTQVGLPLATIPPNSLKMAMTGVGNAKKPVMMMALYKRFGIELTEENQCDAMCLAICNAVRSDCFKGGASIAAAMLGALSKIEAVDNPFQTLAAIKAAETAALPPARHRERLQPVAT